MCRRYWLVAFVVCVTIATTCPPGTTAATVAAARATDTGAEGTARVGGLSEQPRLDRPQYSGDHADVLGIDHVGSRIVVGGRGITSIIQGDGSTRAGANLSATGAGDPGRVTWTAPVASAAWWDIQPLGDGHDFVAVGATGAWRFDLRSQQVVWHRPLNGTATTVSRIPGTNVLLAGGSFPGALIALKATNGRRAGYTVPSVTGRIDVPNAGPTEVYRGEVSPDGRWYVGLGMFTSVGDRHREQAFELRLGQTSARVARWRPPAFERDPDGDGHTCGRRISQFLRDVAWAADSQWFVLVSTGGDTRPVCDSASKWTPTSDTPVWVSPTCNDTIHSDLVIGIGPTARILVSGHFKCIGTTRGAQGDPQQADRFGIALLNADGTVNAWKSDKCRAVGGRVLAAVPGGYAVGYDCPFWGNDEAINPDRSEWIPLSRYAFLPATP